MRFSVGDTVREKDDHDSHVVWEIRTFVDDRAVVRYWNSRLNGYTYELRSCVVLEELFERVGPPSPAHGVALTQYLAVFTDSLEKLVLLNTPGARVPLLRVHEHRWLALSIFRALQAVGVIAPSDAEMPREQDTQG